MSDKPKDQKPHPVIDKLECKACGRCIEACPLNLLKMSDDYNERGYHYVVYCGEGCTGCGNCFYTCPEPNGIKVVIPEKKK